jgi:hypothetical protein
MRLPKRSQRRLNLFVLSIMLRIQHAADYGFAHAEAPGKFGVRDAAFTQV